MRQGLTALSIVMILSILGFAQTKAVEEKWERFSPASDEFLVESPLTLTQRGDSEPASSRKFFGSINGAYLYVFSDPVKDEHYTSVVRRYLAQWGQSLDTASNPASISFQDAYGYHHNLTLVKTDARIYIAQTVSLDKASSLARRFIRSFELGDKRFAPIEAIKEPSVSRAIPATAASNQPGSGGGGGSGRGNAAGVGSGSGSTGGVSTGTSQGPPPGGSAPLRVLAKPRPGYTDMARFYEVQGSIIVRVTFLASGEIGAVSPVTELPFGLTNQVIAAAKRIAFEPTYKDGTATTVVRQVEYTFSIY